MSQQYYTLLTTKGAELLANATALGVPLKLTHMAVGDGNGTIPQPVVTQTKLIHEVRRAPVNTLFIDKNNANQIIAEQVIPESEGGWFIHEIGLYDDKGNLIAVGNCPSSYKPKLTEGCGRTQVIRMILTVDNANAVQLNIDPAVVLASRAYVDECITIKMADHEKSTRHPDATTKSKGFVQLSSATNSDSDVLAATPKAIKTAYDLADSAVKKTGDTMSGSLIISSPGSSELGFQDANKKDILGIWANRDNGNVAYAHQKTNGSNATARFTKASGIFNFDNFDDITISNKSVLTYGSATPYSSRMNQNNTLEQYKKLGILKIDSDTVKINKFSLLISGANRCVDNNNSLEIINFGLNNGNVYLNHQIISDSSNAANRAKYGWYYNQSLSQYELWVRFGTFRGGFGISLISAINANAEVYLNQETTESASQYPKELNYSIPDVNITSSNASNYTPIGIPQPWPTTTPPAGWLKCNGSAFDKTKYPKLAAVYPDGQLPDLRGEFIRGFDDGRGVDSGREILTGQGDAIRNIVGKIGRFAGLNFFDDGAIYPSNATAAGIQAGNGGAQYVDININASRVVPTASENRPRNVAFLYIVKAE